MAGAQCIAHSLCLQLLSFSVCMFLKKYKSLSFILLCFFCFFAPIRWPSQGCCKYQDALSYERQVGKKLANQGLLTKHVPPPACSLLDIFGGDYKPLMTGHRPSCATVLLFWTPWSVRDGSPAGLFVWLFSVRILGQTDRPWCLLCLLPVGEAVVETV